MFSGLAHAGVLRRLHRLGAFQRGDEQDALAGLLEVRRASTISRFAPPFASASSLSAAPPARSSSVDRPDVRLGDFECHGFLLRLSAEA